MRKIISRGNEEKKRRRNQFLVGGVLIFVMLTSVIGYSFIKDQSSNGSSVQMIYDGYTFTQTSGFWNVKIGNSQFSFKYNPVEAPKTSSILNPLGNYQNKPLYIYSENQAAATEIYKNLFYQNQIAQRVQDACIEGENCSNNAPIKTCQDNLIIIKESSNTGITQNNNCVYIEGKMENLTMLSDSFLYKIIGV